MHVALFHLKNLELQEQLRNTNGSLKEHHNMVEQLKRNILDKNDQVSEAQEALGQTVDQLKQKVRPCWHVQDIFSIG